MHTYIDRTTQNNYSKFHSNLTHPNTNFNDIRIYFSVLYIEYKAFPISNVHFTNPKISLIQTPSGPIP